MKIGKLLPLLALAAASLLALSSCDRMLEWFYPDQTNPTGDNSIELAVYTHYNSVGSHIYSGPLTVLVKKADGAFVDEQTLWLSYEGDPIIEASYVFNGLADGSYNVYVWIDSNQNDSSDDPCYASVWPISASVSGGVSTELRADVSKFN